MRLRSLIDAHCHLQEFPNFETIIEEAGRLNVTDFICNGIQENDWIRVIEMNRNHQRVVSCIGIHPWYVNSLNDGWESRMENLLSENPHLKVGEIGLDHYKSKLAPKLLQEQVFRTQIRIALKFNRFMNIHCVSAFGKVLKILRDEMQNTKVPFIMHSYEGPWEMTSELLNYFPNHVYFSLSMVSVSKPKHQSVISRIPISNILIETDSPSQVVKEMIPELSAEDKPSNHPKYLPYVLDKLSLIKGISQENLIEELRDNYERIINS